MHRSSTTPTGHRRARLRGTSVLAAPLVLFAIIVFSLGVASLLWAISAAQADDLGVVATVVIPMLLGVAALVAIRGCFVEVDPSAPCDPSERDTARRDVVVRDVVVRDVVAWRTLRRVPQGSIVSARVRRGVWRLYVLELDDGTLIKLVGASPQQFPAHLLPDAATLDLEDLDTLMGPDPT